MVLTTHFLDEADVLADHVMIITYGHLKCQGSAVELKNRFGGGYRVHLRDSKSGPKLDFPTRRLLDETVYETPDSAAAAGLISTLENIGHSDVFVNGPSIEDVFIKVVAESDVTQEGDAGDPAKTKGAERVLVGSEMALEWDSQLSMGTDTSFLSQVTVLFRKRVTILFRNWWPYLLALAMPIAVTPNLKVFLDFYTIPSCLDLTADVHVARPFNFQLGSNPFSQSMQMLVGPASINETLYNVISKFPVGLGTDIQNYTGQFLFEDNFTAFQNYILSNYTSIIPGGLYMESNNSIPTYAYAGDHGTFSAMLMQNLWTQMRTGIPIVGYFAFFNSLISVRFTAEGPECN
jgi:ATP-binding cassette, subfamily A (ABC1), member 3